jgi:polysaccharide biosynthesis transport protein
MARTAHKGKEIGGSAVMTLLRRHGLWVIVATIVGIAGAWLYYAAQPHVYRSTAQVDVEPNPILGTAAVAANMATEQQVTTSGVVVGHAATALGVTPESLAGHLSAGVTSTANVLSVGCTQPTPAEAQRCAGAVASAYIRLRNLLAGTAAQRAGDPLRVTLVTPATLPTAPAGPGRKILLPIGALLGLALGVGAIVVRDHFDDRVRDRADLERCLEAPVLAAVPRVRRRAVDPAFVFRSEQHSRAAEAYRYLRSRVRPFIAPSPGGRTVLLVTGPQGREGSTCVAANLAGALAHAGASVIAVDADLRHSRRSGVLGAHRSLTEVFHAGERPGLSELLEGTVSLDEVALPAEMPAETPTPPAAMLRFVAAGEPAGRTAEIFDGFHLVAALADMRAAADVVVVDSAPVLAVSDAISLARASDLVIMVADVRRTDRSAVSAAVQVIRASGSASVVGVLNSGQAPVSRWVPATFGRGRESLEPWVGGPAAPAGIGAASRQNGQRPMQLDATPTPPYGWAAIRTDMTILRDQDRHPGK